MRGVVALGLVALLASPASAQQAGADWDLTVDESRSMMLATVGYSSGQTIAVRCRDGELDLLISGLPPAEGQTRRVETVYADGRIEDGAWFASGDGSLVFSPVPGMDARRLRQGGPLQLSVALKPEPESPLGRYAFELPPQSANLDQVLESCGAGGPDPRDDLVRWSQEPGTVSNFWRRVPMPRYPESAFHLGAGFVVFSCVVAEGGRLTDCRAEKESAHRRYGLGQSAVRSLRDARVAPPEEGGPRPGELIVSTIRFQIAS